MKQIRCRDMGSDCDFEASAATEEELFKKVGEHAKEGEPLVTIHASDEKRLAEARGMLLAAYAWSDAPVEPAPLIRTQDAGRTQDQGGSSLDRIAGMPPMFSIVNPGSRCSPSSKS